MTSNFDGAPRLTAGLGLADFARQLEDHLEALPSDDHRQAWMAECLSQNLFTEVLSPDQRTHLIQRLRPRVSRPGSGALGQMNPTPGDLAGNARQILAHYRLACDLGLDWIAFPELSLMGYPIRDVIVRHPFLVTENLRWLHALAARTQSTRMLVGFVEPRPTHAVGKPFYNAVAILGDGRIEGIVRKSLLPNYGEFNDYRTFEPFPWAGVQPGETLGSPELEDPTATRRTLTIGAYRYAISICEDLWNDADFFAQPLYRRDPLSELMNTEANPPEPAADVLLNLSASPSRSRKEQMKHNLLSHIAAKYRRPLVYVNQTGAIDECSFDGASRVYGPQGELTHRARSFQEQFLIVHPLEDTGVRYPLASGLENTLGTPPAQKTFTLHDPSDLGRTYETLCQGIRDYFAKTGFQRALLGLSGGLDSAVVATLLADALGPANVLAVSMPSGLTPEENRSDAAELARNLGVALVEIPIGEMTQAFEAGTSTCQEALTPIWGEAHPGSFARDNVQAISRATLLRMLGNDYRALPVATSDKSEFYLGYTTVNGDMSGALAPLGDVPKTKVRALARWLNAHRPQANAIPEAVIDKPSGADLAVDPETGRLLTAEAALMPYGFADEVIWRLEALHQSQQEMLATPFQWEQENPLSPAQKQAWLNKFFHRMAASVFKWWIAPPVIIVSGNGSITKTDYHHPITANRIAWQGHTAAEMAKVLEGD